MNRSLLSSLYSSGARASRDGGRAIPTIDSEKGRVMKSFTAQGTLVKVLHLAWVLVLFSTPSAAQVVNGSFENDDQPSLDGWSFTFHEGKSFQEAPS